MWPREYPKGFGKNLLKISKFLKIQENPIACLRQKYDYSNYNGDLSLFQNMRMGDTWPDAGLKEIYLYLWKNKRLQVPKEWAATMTSFTRELKEVTWLHSQS